MDFVPLLAFASAASNHVLNHSCVRSVANNGIAGEGADVLANAVLEHASMTDFCGIPLASLRENSVTELNLNGKGVGIPGSIILSKLIPSATALTSLKCVSHPAQRLNHAWTLCLCACLCVSSL